VRSDELRNKRGTDAFTIDLMFTYCQVRMEILLVNPAKRTQKIARRCPEPFDRVGMDLADAIAIVIPRPFFLTVTHSVVDTIDLVVALPFIGVTGGVLRGIAVHMLLQRLPIGMLVNPQTTLPTSSTHGPNNGGAIILIGPVASSLVRAAPRRIARIVVSVAFFPPRSETSHRFPSRDQARPADLTCGIRWPGVVCATDARTDARARVPQLTPSLVRLCKSRVLTTPHGAASDYCPQRGFLYRGCRSGGSADSDNRQIPARASETLAPLCVLLHTLGSTVLWDESVSRPKRYLRDHREAQLEEKSLSPFTTWRTD
jgi:hypothetical protein